MLSFTIFVNILSLYVLLAILINILESVSCKKTLISTAILMFYIYNIGSIVCYGYPHYMIKEINEQPTAIKNTVIPRIKDGLPCWMSVTSILMF